MASRPLEIAVVGCGIAGQAAAVLLADTGHRVTVVERSAEPQGRGAGLLLQPTGLAVLGELGLLEEAQAMGAPIHGVNGRSHLVRDVLSVSYAVLHPNAHGLGIHRGVLFELLHGRLRRSAARLLTGSEIVDVVRDGVRAGLVDKAGARHGPFDLVVVADGAHSALRQTLMPRAHAPIYDWGCIWTTVPDTVQLRAAGLLQQRYAGTTMMMGLLPIGRRPGGPADEQCTTLFWSVPTTELASGKPIDVELWRHQALALWPNAAPFIERAADANDFARATYRHVALPRWNEGPVLFIGDAAHGTSPQLGQGANLGLLDAHALVRALTESDDLATALARFARRRGPQTRFYRQASHLLTPFFQSRRELLGLLRDLLLGILCVLPGIRGIMATTLAGTRRGWLSAAQLDGEGRYRLDPSPARGRWGATAPPSARA